MPEGEHFTPEMLDRDEHPHDAKYHIPSIANEVAREALRAATLHKPMNSHHEAKSVIEEEFNEYWDLVKLNPRKPMTHPTKGYALTPEQRNQELREELIQTAAMCVRAVHDLCSQ